MAHTAHRNVTGRRRGLALMMVMVVIGAASVLALGMTAASSMRARVSKAATTRQQAQYLAESGLNLAIYYIKNPKASPVGIDYGENGNVHYRGEPSISIPGLPGTISTSVTNPANGEFRIVSTGTYDGQTATATATVRVKKSKQLTYAAYMAGTVQLTTRTTISGGLITNVRLQPAGANQVTGLVSDSKGGNAADVAATDFTYPVSSMYYMPTYYYQGREYTARVHNANNWNGGELYDDNPNNPLNIWYFKNGVKIKGPTSITGTIIVPEGKTLELGAHLNATARGPFPAVVVMDNIVFTTDLAVNINGIVYLGNELTVRGTPGMSSTFNVNGSLMSPRTRFPVSSTYLGWFVLNYNSDLTKMEAFADEMEGVDSLSVIEWEINDVR